MYLHAVSGLEAVTICTATISSVRTVRTVHTAGTLCLAQ